MPDSPLLLLQLLVILTTARACGMAVRRLGQPAVIGEMVAGILLGPIVLGAWSPQFHAALFPEESLGALNALGQFGMVLFMFIVGVELRAPRGVRAQLRAASYVGVLSIVLPMALGLAIAPALHGRLAPAGVAFWPFALFVAAALGITAFPVMARILKDQGSTRSAVGQISLASAAIVDVLAWIVLALVIGLIEAGHSWIGFLKTMGGFTVLLLVAFGVLKPIYARVLARHALDDRSGGTVLAALLLGALACAAITEWLQLHAVFGAFLFGACLPRHDRLLQMLIDRVEHIAIVALLPIFFVLAGLQTTADAFVAGNGLAIALILFAAIGGKVAGAASGARLAGYSWRESLAVGSLMNARGLMELVVIGIGLETGVIGPQMFTILLLLAIVTTMMAGPCLMLFGKPRPGDQAVVLEREGP